jgi:shikimate dehydrogenase
LQQGEFIRAGVIGWPVSHSLSPRLHGFWLNKYNIAGSYQAVAVEPDAFSQVLQELEKLGFKGANITVPYKEQILTQLHEVDDMARKIGAVNTITFENGKWRGANTDAYGFMESLRANSDVWKEGYALVLGAGGASRAVCVGLMEEGFEVVLANRSRPKAEAIEAHLKNKKLRVIDWGDIDNNLKDASLLVNTTTLGMKGREQLDIPLSKLDTHAYVADIVYSPEPTACTRRFSNPCITDFLARATENGNSVVDGLGMLLFQAQAGFEMWFGTKPEVTRSLRSHVLEGLLNETPAAK